MTGYRPNSPRTASLTEYFPEPNIYLQSFTLIFSGIAESHIFLKSLDDSFTRVGPHTGDPYVNIRETRVSNSFNVIGTLFLESSCRSLKKALKALSERALHALVKEPQDEKNYSQISVVLHNINFSVVQQEIKARNFVATSIENYDFCFWGIYHEIPFCYNMRPICLSSAVAHEMIQTLGQHHQRTWDNLSFNLLGWQDHIWNQICLGSQTYIDWIIRVWVHSLVLNQQLRQRACRFLLEASQSTAHCYTCSGWF